MPRHPNKCRPKPLTKLVKLTKKAGVLRPRDLAPHGIARQYLSLAVQQGLLVRTARGLYEVPDAPVTELHTVVEAAKRCPRGVVCLLSALSFHQLGTQLPFQIWMGIGEKDRRPRDGYPQMRIFRYSKKSLEYGQVTHQIEGVPVRVFSLAKTVADCFKYRSKFGLDVALEALTEALRFRRATPTELWEAAEVCRVSTVMRPYMQVLLC